MTMRTNPFRPTKFEEHDKPLLCITSQSKLQFGEGNFYFTGKRGCGKTTCLRISDTEYMLKNTLLADEQAAAAASRVFGAYLRLNKRFLPILRTTPTNKDNKRLLRSSETKEQIISEFLELSIVRSTVSALANVLLTGHYKIPLASENGIYQTITRIYRIDTSGQNLSSGTFSLLMAAIDDRLRSMLNFARGTTDVIPNFDARLDIGFHEAVGTISACLRDHTAAQFIRLLIDDCEVLDEDYQKAIGTLVRIPENKSVFWSIAYVDGKFNPKATNVNNQSAQSEERTVIYLDRQQDDLYRQFADDIVSRRIGLIAKQPFILDVSKKLGHFDINQLALASLAGTRSSPAMDFIDRTRNLSNDPVPRFYEQHLIDRHFGLDIPPSDGMRKKNVAAYISLCARYGLHVKYAGANVVLALSDGCIRDYLEIMAAIFDASWNESGGNDFLDAAPLSINQQDEGCKTASQLKLSSIKDFTEIHGLVLEALVLFLGALVRRFQTGDRKPTENTPKANSHITNPERAIFGVNVHLPGFASEDFALLRDGEVDGYLREVEVKGGPKNHHFFRLHRRFAPRFEYSYREGEGIIYIPSGRIREIRQYPSGDPAKWADAIYVEWRDGKKSNQDRLGEW